jgi:hypothetical protein
MEAFSNAMMAAEESGFGGTIWLVVGVLAAIALLIYIVGWGRR